MSLSVRVVGVGDAFTARYYNACLLIEADDTRVLVDAPPALARALGALGSRGGPALGLDDIDHVLITHLHGDHVGGLEQLLFWRRFVTRRRCALHAIPEVLAGLWSERLRGGMSVLMDADGAKHPLTLDDYADVRPMPADPRAPFTLGALTVAWRPTVHHIPTSALRFSHGGTSFGYSADTAYDPGLIAWLAEADLMVHETNLGVHTPLDRLAALDAPLRDRMRLIHYPDWHDLDTSPIASAREGDRYDL
jgi:ribonuclease BN (tRNA processing enzyme)